MYGQLCWLWLGVGEGGEGNGSPLQYSKSMGRGAWWAAVHGVAKSQTRLSDFTFTFYFHALEKEMATHSSVLAWRIPGTGEPGGLPSMGSHRVGHNWSDLAAAAAVHISILFQILFPHRLLQNTKYRVPCAIQLKSLLIICFIYSSVYMLIPTS